MKQSLLCLLLLILAATFVYAEMQVPIPLPGLAPDNTQPNIARQVTRNGAPDYEFHINPMNIINSYYDYFPGSYASYPLRMQPSPAGMFDGGGMYLVFQATPEAGGIRRVYYAYIDDGNITSTALVNANAPANRPEGFPSMDIDWDSGNPMFAWHSAPTTGTGAALNCYYAHDQYDAIGFPGIFNEAYEVIRNPYQVGDEDGNEFIWPILGIGPSPNEGMKRVYISARNHIRNADDYPIENTMIAYADFETVTDLDTYNPDLWSYISIPQMDHWRELNVRTFSGFTTSKTEGTVGIIGHATQIGEGVEPYNEYEILFLLENTNYGEGDWQLYTGDPTIRVTNPINPADNLGYWRDEDDVPYQDIRYKAYVNRHTPTIDEFGNYHFLCMFAMMNEGNTWYPRFTTTKHVKFNRETEEFEIQDLYPRTEDGSTYVAWDIPPRFSEEGFLYIKNSWPIYWWDNADLFHENYHRIVSDGPYMVALFQESIKAKFYHDLGIEAYSTWSRAPETYIYLSNDYGETWSEPIIMNANSSDVEPTEDGVYAGNYEPVLQGMIPTYWYLGDNIEMLNDDWGRVHLMLFSQNDYGSSIQENSPMTGGNIMYTVLDLNFNFETEVSVERDTELLPEVAALHNNYPNPFNPATTISYSVPAPMDVTLQVYNVRGQLVKTLVDGFVQAGERYAVWNGVDDTGRAVGSGVYFYKLTTETHTDIRKMVLVK